MRPSPCEWHSGCITYHHVLIHLPVAPLIGLMLLSCFAYVQPLTVGTMTRRLFTLPTEVKERYPLDPAKNIGWESQSQVRPSTGFPDQKESMCADPSSTPVLAVCLDCHAYTNAARRK